MNNITETNLTKSKNYDAKQAVLFSHLSEQLQQVLDFACEEDSLDYFKIEISNHNGSIQLDYQFRDRTKVY